MNDRKAIHGLLLLLVVGVLWNCAGSPPELIPEPITEKIVQPKPVVAIPPSPPNSISINSITYDRYSMTIQWHSSLESDFNKYILLVKLF